MRSLSRVHLNGLRAVEAAGRLGTLAKAAASLNVSPGAVSKHILNTERQLGRVIFLRTPKGLEPTDFGRSFLVELTDGFRTLSRAAALADSRSSSLLSVSVPPVFAAKWLVPRLSAFGRDNPDLQLYIEATTEFADLGGGNIDAAVRFGSGAWPNVCAEPLLGQMIFPVCSPELAPRLRELRDLSRVKIIREQNSMIDWLMWLEAVGAPDIKLDFGPTFSDAALCLDAAIANLGVALAWQTHAVDAISDGRLRVPFPIAARTGLSYWFVTSKKRLVSSKEAAFRCWLRREITRSIEDVDFTFRES